MGVATRVAGWDRRMPRNPAGPLGTPQGSSVGGTPFLPDDLDSARLIVLAGFGADLTKDPAFWAANFVDITRDVLQDSGRTVSMKVGRQDWSSTAFPATCTFACKNLTGDYSAYNPLSKNWPNLVPGTPIWVRLFVGGVYYTRFFGEAAGFKPSWDTTGNYAITIISANGILNRLGLGAGTGQGSPLRSAIYRYVQTLAPSSIYAYWPLEDGSSSVSGASAVAGGSAMLRDTSAAFPIINFAALDVVPGSAPLPNIANGTAMSGMVSGASSTSWSVQLVINFGSVSSTDSAERIILVSDSQGGGEQLYINPGAGNWRLNYNKPAGGFTTLSTVTFANSVNPFDGLAHRILLNWSQSGGNIVWSFYVDGILADSGSTAATLGAPINAYLGGLGTASFPFAIGHVLLSAQGPDLLSAMNGYTGETATARLTRLCSEEGIPYSTIGRTGTTAMGPQRVDTLVNLLRECEATDAGLLYDGLGAGLQYQPLAARYNAATVLSLDASAGHLLPPFDPQDDLFGRVNRVAVSNRKGGTGTFEDDTGPLGVNLIGPRVGSPPVQPNYSTDTPLRSRAGHEVRKGTAAGFRYPTFTMQLRKIPTKIPGWLSVVPGSAISITPPYPAQLPTDALLEVVEGWQEDLSKLAWTVTPFCSRGDVYQVGKVGGARVDTAGSTLTQPAAVGAASLSVASIGTVWGTSNLPCDFWINGIRVTATAITGATSPQTFTVTGVTKQLYAGDTVRLWTRAYPALG